MTKNNGISSLNFLYEQASNYKKLPSGDWRKTLRGVLYREINRGRFKKVGLGVYGLVNHEDKASAYSYAVNKKPPADYLQNVKDYHSTIEGMLIEIGNFFEYITYTGDPNKSFDNKKLRELCGMASIPDFTYPELRTTISKCDAIWFTKSKLLFPKYVFEVESTTDFTNSMVKMYQLLNFDAKFTLVAPEKRKGVFANRISREPFVKESHRFAFRSFEDVTKLYFSSVEHYELKSKFLSYEVGRT
ncbi:MAG: hypothetical protein HYX85_00210 [Chloroflexi bacterium]|nr:hypothetical protein [Chloroflexota bacterium]